MVVNITGLYWRVTDVQVNGSEYRYFAYGMHSEMETPPTFSYVCTNAIFVKYNPAGKYGTYNFSSKFFISNMQVKLEENAFPDRQDWLRFRFSRPV